MLRIYIHQSGFFRQAHSKVKTLICSAIFPSQINDFNIEMHFDDCAKLPKILWVFVSSNKSLEHRRDSGKMQQHLLEYQFYRSP